MATGNFLLGTVRKKLGDVVFYRTDGEQRSRSRIRSIKNPRSQAQQIQRSIMATVTQAYSAMSSIVDHSFESIQYGQRSMYYFNKINADMLRTLYAEDIKLNRTGREALAHVTAPKVSAFIMNPYIISKGTLKSPFVITKYVDGYSGYKIKSEVRPNNFGEAIKSMNLMSTNSMLTEIIIKTNYNYIYTYKGDEKTDGAFIMQNNLKTRRIVRNTTEISQSDMQMSLNNSPSHFGDIMWEKYLDKEKSDKTDLYMLWSAAIGKEGITLNPNFAMAFAFISSEKIGNTWKRSTSRLNIFNRAYPLGLNQKYGQLAWSETTQEIGENEYYLNKGKY